MIEYNNCCVACGEIIPEGRQVCSQCEKGFLCITHRVSTQEERVNILAKAIL